MRREVRDASETSKRRRQGEDAGGRLDEEGRGAQSTADGLVSVSGGTVLLWQQEGQRRRRPQIQRGEPKWIFFMGVIGHPERPSTDIRGL